MVGPARFELATSCTPSNISQSLTDVAAKSKRLARIVLDAKWTPERPFLPFGLLADSTTLLLPRPWRRRQCEVIGTILPEFLKPPATREPTTCC